MIDRRLITQFKNTFTAHTQRKTKIKEIRRSEKKKTNCDMEKWHHRHNETSRNKDY